MLCCFGYQPDISKSLTKQITKQAAKRFYNKYTLSTPSVSLEGVTTWCRVLDVYDGDSITVAMPLQDKQYVYKFPVRIDGIDTCEMNSKLSENRYKAVLAKERVIQLITGLHRLPPIKNRKEIQEIFASEVYLMWIECKGMDKYGRVLANVKKDPQTTDSISSTLLQEKLAYPYNGGTKMTEDQQSVMVAPT